VRGRPGGWRHRSAPARSRLADATHTGLGRFRPALGHRYGTLLIDREFREGTIRIVRETNKFRSSCRCRPGNPCGHSGQLVQTGQDGTG
jgi:hypothetical protein